MYKNIVVILLLITFLGIMNLTQCQVSVGVREGDWIEYDVVTTGNPVEGHDIKWARMEIFDIQGSRFQANITSENLDGIVSVLIRTFDLEEGDVEGWVIIPANLDVGDIFYDSYIGRDITIEGEEEMVVTGATRTTTFADIPERFKRWDKATGVFVETIDYLETYTIHATMVATNMWSPEIFGLNPILFYIVVILAVLILAVLVSLIIIKRRK